MQKTAVQVTGLRKSFRKRGSKEEARGVEDVTFQVEQGEFFTLLGPSGCGKTTTLRCIAGLESPDAGAITIAGSAVVDADRGVFVPANRRGLGMVFQSYAIWPHMTVAENVAFPLRHGPSGKDLKSRSALNTRVAEILKVVELDEYANRRATAMSGGQQQRLALARALVMRPSVLLLDEPLSNLDASLRDAMRLELKRIQRELGITTIYVTHDQREALTLSNRIAVLDDGLVRQVGKPRQIYEEPNNRFVASFVGTVSWVRGLAKERTEDGRTIVNVGPATLIARRIDGDVQPGSECRVAIRPEAIRISETTHPTASRQLEATVVNRAYQGESVLHVVELYGDQIKVEGPSSISVPPGKNIYITLPETVPLAVDSNRKGWR